MATEYFEKIGNLRGADGKGVPVGGTQGQILKKIGNTDFATAWSTLNYSEIGGKVPAEALPAIGNATFPVDSEAKMLALAAVPGNMASAPTSARPSSSPRLRRRRRRTGSRC